jgi:CheY-like chemotaxis protein
MVDPRKTVVLVVEPDHDIRGRYRESFERHGCEVMEAFDGRDALALALTRPPTLVVTETTLPFVDGYALCEILRRDQATTQVPILVVTSDPRDAEWRRALRSGASAVLVKPTSADEVWTATQRLIEAMVHVRTRPAESDRPSRTPSRGPAPDFSFEHLRPIPDHGAGDAAADSLVSDVQSTARVPAQLRGRCERAAA